ncbi:SMI1/KNR4 family protein [Pedobacter sp. GR22-6]|uniref:SMI1/KNR4 family protein n=1 Tax=Pedobacter sp. GR22-6 TaxID=3127957 RepID=UPI00307E22EF
MNSEMKIDDAIALLNSYSGPFELILHPAASEALIHAVEQAYDTQLPEDFKSFYRFTNGFEIDEDIFNMISLDEMISNSKDDKRPAIAEFMIYSDLWYLEIDYTDDGQYRIYV